MNHASKIMAHSLFIECTEKIKEYEDNRKFCLHDRMHFLEVTRIMEVINIEDGLDYPLSWIQGAGLLHDIGKFIQYETGEPHQYAGVEIARKILVDCDYHINDIEIIIKAIQEHSGWVKREGFSELLRKSDKLSRRCFECKASVKCKWPIEMRNKRSYL